MHTGRGRRRPCIHAGDDDVMYVLASTHELKRFLTVKRALCIVPGQKFTGEQGRSIWTIN